MNLRRQIDPVMQAIAAKSGVPEGFAQGEFGFGVLRLISAHHPRNRFALGRRRAFVADVHKAILATNGHECHESTQTVDEFWILGRKLARKWSGKCGRGQEKWLWVIFLAEWSYKDGDLVIKTAAGSYEMRLVIRKAGDNEGVPPVPCVPPFHVGTRGTRSSASPYCGPSSSITTSGFSAVNWSRGLVSSSPLSGLVPTFERKLPLSS